MSWRLVKNQGNPSCVCVLYILISQKKSPRIIRFSSFLLHLSVHSWVQGKQEVLIPKLACSKWCQLDNKILEGAAFSWCSLIYAPARWEAADVCLWAHCHCVTVQVNRRNRQNNPAEMSLYWHVSAAVLPRLLCLRRIRNDWCLSPLFLDKYHLKTDSFHVISPSLTSIQCNRRLAFCFIPQSHYSTFSFLPALAFSLNRRR